MFQAKPVLIQTSNFGGAQGTRFNDSEEASGFPASQGGIFIDPQRPIKEMEIFGGWCIDAIKTTYRMSDGTTKTIQHGSAVSANLTRVALGEHEIISQICGFAGTYPHYQCSTVIALTLVITDTVSGLVRIVGPIGGWNGNANGQFFSVSNPMCFAGFEKAGSVELGICGLSIIKSNMVE
ncbi:hypothetical protein B0H11DRAFT_2061720 [Mycena galericulata]|nr:hypothetical protein B0H11DRAFT_2061720 [Mycena galericulata]